MSRFPKEQLDIRHKHAFQLVRQKCKTGNTWKSLEKQPITEIHYMQGEDEKRIKCGTEMAVWWHHWKRILMQVNSPH